MLLEMIYYVGTFKDSLELLPEHQFSALLFQLLGGDLMVKLFSLPWPPSTPPQMASQIRKVSRSLCLHALKGHDTDIPSGIHDIPPQFTSRPQALS